MPLPAALAARLAQRGILPGSKKNANLNKEPKRRVHEEVIAEDYDNTKEDFNTIDIAQKFMGYPSCPNKCNIYHECTRKCKDLWGKGHAEPSERYLKRQMKLLKKYPLPETWKAVYDPGSGLHYYWDWSSDLVAWLPPTHPKCQISQPASQLREELHLKAAEQDDINMSSDESGSDQDTEEIEEPEPKRDKKDNKERDIRDNRNRERDNRDNRERDRDRERERDRDRDRDRDRERDRDRDRHRTTDSRPRHYKPDKSKDSKKDRTLDPMDPAAYSDIPRGKWSDGLPMNNEAKTGVDTTASGPLYQMRPYPSPGAVLRSNKANNKEEEDIGKQKESPPEDAEE